MIFCHKIICCIIRVVAGRRLKLVVDVTQDDVPHLIPRLQEVGGRSRLSVAEVEEIQ